MNKIKLLLLVLLWLPGMAQAQESPAQKWIRSFEGQPGITTISISRTMFKLLSKVRSSDPDYQKIARFAAKLQDFKIMVIEGDGKINTAKATAAFSRLVNTTALSSYNDLMTINEGGNHIAFRVLEHNDRIQELIMTITGTDHVVMMIKGDFMLEELTDISDDLNISGMNKIQKLKK